MPGTCSLSPGFIRLIIFATLKSFMSSQTSPATPILGEARGNGLDEKFLSFFYKSKLFLFSKNTQNI